MVQNSVKNSSSLSGSDFEVQAELEETQRALKEVALMIEQSQGEVEKLTQRNTAITAHLQQIQSQTGQLPIEEVRTTYETAINAQQRLFVMRGRLEKLQSDKLHLERYKALLERMNDSTGQWGRAPQAAAGGNVASVDMLIEAQEAERQRLSRLMHDGPAQALSNFILQTEIAMRLMDVDPDQVREELGNLKVSAISTFQKVRNFIFELRPMMLDDIGLLPTIQRYTAAFKEQTGLEVDLTVTGNERRLEAPLEVMIFRALQELLGNVARHSQASVVKVHVELDEGRIRVSVDDNGKGFDPQTLQQAHSLGLKLIQERVEMLGGTFEIDSAPGKGARIAFSIPL
jgi:two-component system sensor histidine kinase DegS